MESILAGFSSASNISSSRLKEEQFLLGHSKMLAVISQLVIASTTLYLAKEACGWSEVPLSARYSFYALSSGTALALHFTEPPKDQREQHHSLRRRLFAIHRNIGALCEWTAFGAALAMTVQGSRTEGGITAGLIAAGYLHRNSLLPQALDKPYEFIVLTQQWLGIAWAFGYGSRTEKLVHGAVLATCYAQPNRAIDDIRLLSSLSTWQQRTTTSDNNTFKLDWNHIEAAVGKKLPLAPADINLEKLLDHQEWFKTYDQLAEQVLDDDDDDNWKKNPDTQGTSEVDYLKAGLRKLIDKASGKDPSFVGKPDEIKQLRNLLRLFIQKLDDKTIDERARAQMLCQMGAHGHYCGDGYLGMTQHVYFYLTGDTDKLTFKDAVHRLLAEERKRVFDVAMNRMWSIYSKIKLAGLIDPEIVEKQFEYIRTFGPLCGHPWLQTARAASGATTWFVPAIERVGRIIAGNNFLQLFYSEYTPTNITKLVQGALKKRIKNPVVNQALLELCNANETLNIDDAFDGDELKESWIQYLLVHCGIFKHVNE